MLFKTLAPATVICSAAIAEDAPQQQWTDLLANNSLELWQGQKSEALPSSWSLNDGILHFNKKNGTRGSLVTKKAYFSFEMSFEWKISKAGNSGVKYRTKNGLGLEYQVLDDKNHRDRHKMSHRTSSLYEIAAAPETKPINPVGEWNQSRIVANGNQIEHWLNGTKVIAIIFGSPEWKAAFEKSKYKKIADFAANPGSILLQDHDDEVWYRNIKIKALTPLTDAKKTK